MSKMNRLANVSNRYQGDYKKVLTVCSAGLLRSPTTAFVLSQEPYNYNTRPVGISDEYALIHIDEVHVAWADEIVCMEKKHQVYIEETFGKNGKLPFPPIVCLDIPDDFRYRDPKLMDLIRESYNSKQGI